MSLVINTNSAATAASNNLAMSNVALQRSLNRLSSGSKIVSPADDAGGLAVSMKLSAAARRQGAAITNVGNSMSFLQTQDGALKVAGKVLDRISELKTLASDPTKSSSDIANYNTEFVSLQTQLTSLGNEAFNGVSLFGSSTFDVSATEDGSSTIEVGGIELLGGGGGGGAWTDFSGFAMGTDWNESPGGLTLDMGGGEVLFTGNGTVTSAQTNISGPYTMSFTFLGTGADNEVLTVSLGGASLNLTAITGDIFGNSNIEIVYDGVQTTYSINGGPAAVTADISTPGGGPVTFTHSGYDGPVSTTLENFSITNTGGGGGGSGNISDVTTAASLSAIDLTTITGAIQDLATYRATNGAQQSRLGFASELLATNKSNLEAANSRIVDVDVATESTLLARQNILVQSGTAMLAQANQSTQSIMRLLG